MRHHDRINKLHPRNAGGFCLQHLKKANQQQWNSKEVANTGTVMRTPDPELRSHAPQQNATSSVVTPRDEHDVGGSEGHYQRHLSPSRSEDDAVDSKPNNRGGSVESPREYVL